MSHLPPYSLTVAGKQIGANQPCFVIAEAGVNHQGELSLALRLIDEAKEAGADAVKFQSFRADYLAAESAPLAAYQTSEQWGARNQRELLRKLELSASDHLALIEHCQRREILFLSSPFDEPSLELLSALEVPVYKVASGELTNLPLLKKIAGQGKPVFVSTGMASLAEVTEAVACFEPEQLAILHCVSRYPAEPCEANLRAMQTMREIFRCPVGFSDHTLGIEISLAAVALGAAVIEKHFTLDKRAIGPDHASSVEPRELAALVRGIRRVEAALGDGAKQPVASESEIALVARKSLVAKRTLPAGELLRAEDFRAQRPGTGVSPAQLEKIVGRRLRRDLREGELLRWEYCE